MSKRKRHVPGITVYRRGRKYAYTVYHEHDLLTGKRQRANAGGFDTEDDAWAAALEAQEKLNRREHVRPSHRTVKAFFAEWLEVNRHTLKPTTYGNYLDYLDAYVLPVLGERRLQDITVQVLNAFYRHLLSTGRRKPDKNTAMYTYWVEHTTPDHDPKPKEIAQACDTTIHAARAAVLRYRRGRIPTPTSPGLAPKTVKNAHRLLHRALADAVRWNYISSNPAEHAALPRTPAASRRQRKSPWTLQEMTSWLDHALQDRLAAMWILVATTGIRRGELAGVHRNHLDLEHKTLTILPTRTVVRGRPHSADETKSAAGERTISLDDVTAEWLAKHLSMLDAERTEFGDAYQGDGHLFCFPNGAVPHPDTITRMFNRLVDRADAPRIRLHDVRHAYATLSLDAGINIKIVSDRLGHANTTVTSQIYGHRSTGHDREAAQAMATLFMSGLAHQLDDGSTA